MKFTLLTNFLKNIEVRKKKEKELQALRPDFKVLYYPWLQNRHPHLMENSPTLKFRCGFNDLALLDNCPLVVKIGINTDVKINTKYICFIYGDEKVLQNIKDFVRNFLYVELISGLNSEGVITSHSKVEVIIE